MKIASFFPEIAKRKKKKILFELMAPEAIEVFLAGDFNEWNACQIPMKKDKNGVFKTQVKLCSGRYEYKFFVDGNWWTDPDNHYSVETAPHVLNSVKRVII